MSVIIGGLVLDNTNGPATLPIEVSVDGQLVKLSDGSNQFQDTGLTPSVITISGTLNYTDTAPKPLDLMDQLAAIRDRRQRVLLRWSRYQWWGLVTRLKASPKAQDRCDYEIDFQIESSGAAAANAATSRTRRVSSSLNAIGTRAPTAGPSTAGAWAAVQAARSAAGY